MNFDIFEDGEYVVESSKVLKRSDEVYLTTSEFDFDASNGTFTNDKMDAYAVQLVIVSEDLSDFDADKCRNGGKYGFAKGIATSVKKID